jgi:hypothetical protein
MITDQSTCLQCGYPLRGLRSCRCPECGRAFDPSNRRTYGPPAPHKIIIVDLDSPVVAIALAVAAIVALGWFVWAVTLAVPVSQSEVGMLFKLVLGGFLFVLVIVGGAVVLRALVRNG